VRGVGVWNRALPTHPVEGGAGIQAARKRQPDAFADRKTLKNVPHYLLTLVRYAAPDENLVPIVGPHNGLGARPSTMLGTPRAQSKGGARQKILGLTRQGFCPSSGSRVTTTSRAEALDGLVHLPGANPVALINRHHEQA